MGEENNSIACAFIFLQALTVHPYFLAQSLQAFLTGAQSLLKFYWAHQLPYTLGCSLYSPGISALDSSSIYILHKFDAFSVNC